MQTPELDTYHKALAFNMDKTPYGTIAEIGAGQEISRWFFKVGGAASSIAKTMSAYDMKFSDSIYGSCRRYVSRERLQAMLDKEYSLVVDRLAKDRGDYSTFFAFANTVSTYSYTKQRPGHGWLGIRFQTKPEEAASQIDLHVELRGKSNTQDQESIGILGVNLIYGAHYYFANPLELLLSLMDNLSTMSLEIDMIDFNGPAFTAVDNRLMALHLVKNGFTHAAMFNANGKLVQPSDTLYKRSVLIERGNFRPPTLLAMNILDNAYEAFIRETGVEQENVLVLSEMTLENLSSDIEAGSDIDVEDFLHRAEILCSLGKNVMVSNFGEFYKLAQYLYYRTSQPVAVALGIQNMLNIFDESYYENLEGGILEAFGKLFRHDMRLYVCPKIDDETNGLVTSKNLRVSNHLRHLYRHLMENGYLKDLEAINHDYLLIKSKQVLQQIRDNDPSWMNRVPEAVVSIIKQRSLFRKIRALQSETDESG